MDSTPRKAGRPKDPVPRATLLELASRAFAARGYAGASMARIAESAGIRKSSLFHHFSSKEALYDEVFSVTMDGFDELLARTLAVTGPFPERLDRLTVALTEHLATHPTVARLLMRELASGGVVLDRPGRARVETTLRATVALFEAAMEAGEMPRQDGAHLVLTLVGLHLTAFAAPDVSAALLGGDLTDAAVANRRARAVQQQVRRLCGLQE